MSNRRPKPKRERSLAFPIAIAAILVVGGALIFTSRGSRQAPEAPEGVQTFGEPSRDHVERTPNYPQTPPVGGPHLGIWQTCGFYDEPIDPGTAVHSMEHGAVWIVHDPDLPEDAVDELRSIADQSYVLVSPWPNPQELPSPVVASAWGVQLPVESVDDPGLERFVAFYRSGPQTPEPGASCSGGAGDPA